MTNDGTNLIMTDGSATLYFRDPSSFDLLRTVVVKVFYFFVFTKKNLLYISATLSSSALLRTVVVKVQFRLGLGPGLCVCVCVCVIHT
jgi:glutamine cyclotransferase